MRKKLLLLVLLLFPLVCFGQGIDADTHLIMHMDGADDGTTFSDDSITNNKGNASVTATATTETTGPKWGTASALFDGDSGYLSYDDDADWDIAGSDSDDWTIDFWVKHDDHVDNECYISQVEDTNNKWLLYHTHGEGLRFYYTKSGYIIDLASTYGGEITDTDWHHIAFIKKAAVAGLYLDGTQVVYGTQTDVDTLVAPFDIGDYGEGLALFFDGYIDELRIQHSNIFGATPNDTPNDTITVPTGPYSVATAAGSQVIINFVKRADGKGYDRIVTQVQ